MVRLTIYDILLYTSAYATALGFFAAAISILLSPFHPQEWWIWVVAALLGLLAPFLVYRLKRTARKRTANFLYSPVGDSLVAWLSRSYIALAAIAFLSPFAWFCTGAFYGAWNPAELGFATMITFYLLKFVDYQVITEPRRRLTHVYAAVFVFLALLQFVFLSPLSELQFLHGLDFMLPAFAAFTLVTHGFWMRSVYSERKQSILQAHPRLYFEIPYRGVYNVVAGMILMAYLYVQLLLGSRNLEVAVGAILAILILMMMVIPFTVYLGACLKEMHQVRYGKEYKKLRPKVEKDSWDNEVVAKSKLARVIHSFVYLLVGLSLFSATYLVYLFALTLKIPYLVSALLCVFGVFPTQSYRMGSQATRLKDFMNLFPHVVDSQDVRGLVGVVLAIYGIAIGIFIAGLFLLRTYGLESTLLSVSGIEITNVALLAVVLVVSFLVVTSVSVSLYASRDVARKRLNHMLAVLVVVTYLSVLVSVNLVISIVIDLVVAALLNALATVFFFILIVRVRKYLRK